ncbi:MAG: fibro-slime domain-containing protein [Planctomycetota bacterium]|nr:fibro-slime domain-containing protein [Planctomycetota bacterium]
MSETIASMSIRQKLLALGIFSALVCLLINWLLPTPHPASAYQATPSVIAVPGIVRDFRMVHPDFHIVPADGQGHYAGNVAIELGADSRPVFEGDGFNVASQWRDKNSQPIAPHLYGGIPPIQLSSAPLMQSGTMLDSWDPDDGRYGEDGNIGPAPDVYVGATMPTIKPPTDLGSSLGNVAYNPGFETISTSFRCSNLTIKSDSLVQIDGDITIRVNSNFTMQQNASLELLEGARLRLYVGGGVATFHTTSINMVTLDPTRLLLYYYGTGQIDISQYSKICASVVAPQGSLELGQDAEFYGTYYGAVIDMRQGSQFHSSGVQVIDQCGEELEDRIGVIGFFAPGAVTSEATFNQWYNDVLGTNLSQVHTITLTRNWEGIYEVSLPEFYPIDDRLFGNEGKSHNSYFTYSFNASFTYIACSGQFFEFAGADDVWLFIDGELGLDLGGVQPGVSQIIELERLGLTDGQTYALQFFYAQRNPSTSRFSMRTNVVVIPQKLVGAGTASYD